MTEIEPLTSRRRQHIQQFLNVDERLTKIRTKLSQQRHTLEDLRATRRQLDSGDIKSLFQPCGGGQFMARVTNMRTAKKHIDGKIDELEDIVANLEQSEQKAADLWREYRNRVAPVFSDDGE